MSKPPLDLCAAVGVAITNPDPERRGPALPWPAALPALLLLALSGCSSSSEPIDLVALIPATDTRVEARPLPPVWVKLGADRRPLEQRGDRKYLGTSTFGDGSLLEPTHVVVLKVLARDLTLAGVSERASIRDQEQPLILEVSLDRCAAAYGEGLENLLLILPTSRIEATCKMGLLLKDLDGRTLLQDEIESDAKGSASMLSGLESSAARVLARAIKDAVEKAVVRLSRAKTAAP